MCFERHPLPRCLRALHIVRMRKKLLDAMGDPEDEYHVGEVVEFATPDGNGTYAGAVLQVREDGALRVDFNHPLAGRPVTFEVQIIGVL